MVKSKLKWFVIMVCTAIIVIAPFSAAYAWFTSDIVGTPISFTTANIDSSVTMRKGIDFNQDGNLDLTSTGEFTYGPEQSSTGNNLLILTANNVYPTQIHTWKITITNLGDSRGYVFIRVSNSLGETPVNEGNLFKALSITAYKGDTDTPANEKCYLAEHYDGGVLDCYAVSGGYVNSVNYVEDNNQISIRLCIEFETYENLPLIDGEKPMTYQEYQQLQGQSFDDLFMRIYLISNNSSNYIS